MIATLTNNGQQTRESVGRQGGPQSRRGAAALKLRFQRDSGFALFGVAVFLDIEQEDHYYQAELIGSPSRINPDIWCSVAC